MYTHKRLEGDLSASVILKELSSRLRVMFGSCLGLFSLFLPVATSMIDVFVDDAAAAADWLFVSCVTFLSLVLANGCSALPLVCPSAIFHHPRDESFLQF